MSRLRQSEEAEELSIDIRLLKQVNKVAIRFFTKKKSICFKKTGVKIVLPLLIVFKLFQQLSGFLKVKK